MPLWTIHLLALHSTSHSFPSFLSALKSANISPLVVSRVIRWIILPTQLSTEHLLARNISWDILLILPNTSALPSSLTQLIAHHWHITAGIPSRLLQDFPSKNHALLHPSPSSLPVLQNPNLNPKLSSSAQNLELCPELNSWIDTHLATQTPEAKSAVSMFNLLSFNPGLKSSYLQYGAAFSSSIGSAHGGSAKIVGNVVSTNGTAKFAPPKPPLDATTLAADGTVGGGVGEWDEIALAHYPSIAHFRDMLVSEEYQRVNQRFRVPSLRDTAILMTSEIGIDELMKDRANL